MIVGGYSLDLYCDTPGCKYNTQGTLNVPDSFVASTGERCRQQARRAGWRLNLTEGTAICPKCSRKAKEPRNA